jgi:ABC-type sugar transport system ATPase subunit
MSLSRKLRFVVFLGANGGGKGGTLQFESQLPAKTRGGIPISRDRDTDVKRAMAGP